MIETIIVIVHTKKIVWNFVQLVPNEMTSNVFSLEYFNWHIYICSSFYADELFNLRRDDDDTPRRLRNAIARRIHPDWFRRLESLHDRKISSPRENLTNRNTAISARGGRRDGNEPCRLTGSCSHPFPCVRLKGNDPSDVNRRFNNAYSLCEGKCRRAVIFSTSNSRYFLGVNAHRLFYTLPPRDSLETRNADVATLTNNTSVVSFRARWIRQNYYSYQDTYFSFLFYFSQYSLLNRISVLSIKRIKLMVSVTSIVFQINEIS